MEIIRTAGKNGAELTEYKSEYGLTACYAVATLLMILKQITGQDYNVEVPF